MRIAICILCGEGGRRVGGVRGAGTHASVGCKDSVCACTMGADQIDVVFLQDLASALSSTSVAWMRAFKRGGELT